MTDARVYRTRFAPSPNGAMHLGHVRTHLVAWLRARQAGGEVLMRIEDLDPPRCVPGAADAILRDHEWLGLTWDGPIVYQSQRTPAYERGLEALIARGRAYRCACSRRQVAARVSDDAGDGGPAYDGYCRAHPPASGAETAWRFVMPSESPGFSDPCLGPIAPGAVKGDPVIRRRDGLFAYHLAVVVDDRDAGITELVRGADLQLSTARHLALFDALGASRPAALHLPLLLDETGRKLAKRHGAPGISEMREAGEAADAVIGRVAQALGIWPSGEPVMPAGLVDSFEVEALASAFA